MTKGLTLLATVALAGCPDGGGGDETGGPGTTGPTGGTGGTADDGGTDTAPPTTGGTSATDTGGGPSCAATYPLSGSFVLSADSPVEETLLPGDHCGPESLGLIAPPPGIELDPDTPFTVYLYRPATASDPNALEWPTDRLPVIVFAPGAGQNIRDGQTNEELYRHVFEPLVEQGFIVAAIQTPDVLWPVGKRSRAQFCTLIWLQSPNPGAWSERDDERLNCDVVAMGHSRGGESAYTVVDQFPLFQAESPVMADYTLRAAVAMAPRSVGTVTGDEPTFAIPASRAVPYLTLQGGADHDTPADALRAYDIMAEEHVLPLADTDKLLIWAYDVRHNAWGGLRGATGIPKAEAIANAYIPPFLEWQVFGTDTIASRARFTGLVKADPALSDYPPELQSASLWQHLQPHYDDWAQRPLLLANTTFGLRGDPGARLQVDTMSRALGPFACSDAANQAMILTPSTLGFVVDTGDGMQADQVCLVPAPTVAGAPTHQTDAMLVRWGDTLADGFVRWQIDQSLIDYSYLTLRLGQPYDATQDATSVDIELETGAGGAIHAVTIPVIQQDSFLDPAPPLNVAGRPSTAMHTVRLPLRDLCDRGADIFDVRSIRVRFPPEVVERQIMLDSIEFTDHPEDFESRCDLQ